MYNEIMRPETFLWLRVEIALFPINRRGLSINRRGFTAIIVIKRTYVVVLLQVKLFEYRQTTTRPALLVPFESLRNLR